MSSIPAERRRNSLSGPPNMCEDLRLVVVGRSGVGKSATANEILGIESFRETGTTECEIQRGNVDSRNISVIDTPGMNSPSLTAEQWKTEMKKCLLLSSPGPHVFLLVIRLGDFTEEDRKAVNWIHENFGKEALKFIMILFIGKEHMTKRQWTEFIQDPKTLEFVGSCGGKYFGINSKREVHPDQIRKLLEEIETMVQRNGAQYYIQEKNEAAERKTKTDKTQEEERMKNRNERHREEQERKLQQQKRKEEIHKLTKEDLLRQKEIRMERERRKWEEQRGATGGELTDPEFTQDPKTLEFVGSCGGQYFGINSKREVHPDQFQELQKEVESMVQRNGAQNYIQEKNEAAERKTKTDKIQEEERMKNRNERHREEQVRKFQQPKRKEEIYKFTKEELMKEVQLEIEMRNWGQQRGATGGVPVCDLRIVLLGDVGAGKSSSANTILGREAFGRDFLNGTWLCKRQDGMLGNKSITVIDTQVAELSDTHKQMEKCLSLCSPGPHVFLLVLPYGRSSYTNYVNSLITTFGKEFSNRTLVLFTHADKKQDLQIFLNFNMLNENFQQLLNTCGGRYLFFSNEEKEDQTQLTDLLKKIEEIVQNNGGRCYTAEMCQEMQQEMQQDGSCSLL